MAQLLTGKEFKAIREMCGFSAREVAELLKSRGARATTTRSVYRIEEGEEVQLRYVEALRDLVGKSLFESSLLEIRRRRQESAVEEVREPAPARKASARSRARQASAEKRSDDDTLALTEPKFIQFLNSLPTTGNTIRWNSEFREALRVLLGDVDRVVININLDCDLDNPESYHTDSVYLISEFIQSSAAGSQTVRVNHPTSELTPSERLLEAFRLQGYPIDRYHPPHAFDYYYAQQAYIGTVFLWRELDKPLISRKSIERVQSLEPFMLYAFSDHITRVRHYRPHDRAFSAALELLARNARLSEQERRVVVLQLFGHTYEQIAENLRLSIDAVRKHVKSIYRKTGTHSYTELFAKYFTPRLGF